MHSDTKYEYLTQEVLNFFKEENIKLSTAIADKHQNQVSEAINNQIKYNTVLSLLEGGVNSIKFRNLMRIQPNQFKYQSKIKKAQNKE